MMRDHGADSPPERVALQERLSATLQELGAGPGDAAKLLVAVSGGADSMALLHLLAGSGRKDVFVVTIDHGLRAESAAEAAAVAASAAELGYQHRTLVWPGAAKGAALQDRARAARYSLLAECAAQEGRDAILTAHTADDQAETVFMRLARGSGPAGLKGMAAHSMIACEAGPPVRLLRPLLWARRATLRAFLENEGCRFSDDPSNDDPGFERVRVRALLGALQEQRIVTIEALCGAAWRSADVVSELATAQEAAFFNADGWFSGLGAISLDARAASRLPTGLAARLIRAVSGEDYPPDAAAADAAMQSAAAAGGATLGGALLKRQGRELWVTREPAALLGRDGAPPYGPAFVEPGESRLWDGRFILRNHGSKAADVRALGAEGVAELGARRGLYPAPDAALLAAPDCLFSQGPVHATPLAEERFFARVRRFPKL